MARKKKGGAAKFRKACERAMASGRNNGFTRACRRRFGK